MVTEHTPYLYGMHDLCPNDVLNGKGTIVHAARLGHNPGDNSGVDLSHLQETVICRIQHGWAPDGTLPEEPLLPLYLKRIRNFALASEGFGIWVAWNEPNHSQERPHGQIITPQYAASSYLQIRETIRSLPGRADDLVLVGAIAPWNLETGDWLEYMRQVYSLLGDNVDGITLHAYTHGAHPDLVFSDERRHGWLWHFRTYQQQIREGIPERLHDRPFYITETDQGDDAWIDYNSGWVQNAYRDIDDWNKSGEPTIRSLVLYRWAFDQWEIKDKPGVRGDLHAAMEHGYTWTDVKPPDPDPPEESMLKNPSFEGGWHEQGANQLVLPDEWSVEYLEGANPWHRPEIKPNEEFATDGRYSIRAFAPEHSRTFFGIGQEVDAEPGQWYRFSADVRLESKPDGRLAGFVGIQPWGAGIFQRQMVWGKETQAQVTWQRIEVITQAFGGKIRVSMAATNDFATRNNTTWWDNAKLEKWECEGGTPEPPEPPDPPQPGDPVDYDRIARIMRDELDKTRLGSG